MIGDQHLDPQRVRLGNAGMTCDAVVHGQDQGRLLLRGEPHDLGCQPISILEAVGHEEVDAREAEPA